jgi:hypothetical protein
MFQVAIFIGGVLTAKTEFVMPGRVPDIHSFPSRQNVDGRDKPGHDQG